MEQRLTHSTKILCVQMLHSFDKAHSFVIEYPCLTSFADETQNVIQMARVSTIVKHIYLNIYTNTNTAH